MISDDTDSVLEQMHVIVFGPFHDGNRSVSRELRTHVRKMHHSVIWWFGGRETTPKLRKATPP